MPRAWTRTLPTSRYDAVAAYLQALPAAQEQITLTLTAISELVGGALPPSALVSGYWRHPDKLKRFARAGWEPHFDRGAAAVTFTRLTAAAQARAARAAKAELHRQVEALPDALVATVLASLTRLQADRDDAGAAAAQQG